MAEYPFNDRIFFEDWDEIADGGEVHMKTSSGSWKTHILYAQTSVEFSFMHRKFNQADYDSLMSFWRFNRGRLFDFTLPTDGRVIQARFKNRPKTTDFIIDDRDISVTVIGSFYE